MSGREEIGFFSSIDESNRCLRFNLLDERELPRRTYTFAIESDSNSSSMVTCKVWQKEKLTKGGLFRSVLHAVNPIDTDKLAEEAIKF